MVKCSKCNHKAEFHLPDNPKKVFCEDHAIEYMKKTNTVFLPRIKK